MCVCCHSIYSGRRACGRTSRGHTGEWSHIISPPPSAVLALMFIARSIQLSLSLVYREVESLCTHKLVVLHLLGIILFYLFAYLFLREKIPVRVTAPRFELTSQCQKVSRLPPEPSGRPAWTVRKLIQFR